MGSSGITWGGLVVLIALIWVVGFAYYFSGGGSGAEIEEASVSVTLHEKGALLDQTFGEDTVECDGSYRGPMPGHVEVFLRGTVNETEGSVSTDSSSSTDYRLTAEVADSSESLRFSVDESGSRDFFSTVSFRNNGTLEVGEEVDVNLVLEEGWRDVDTVTRTVTVKEMDIEERCTD